MAGPVIAVIGAGFSGTLLTLHLLRRCPPTTRICLIERNAQFGRGQAYATPNPSHLLNVPAGRMSAFPDQPGHFLDWLRAQPGMDEADAGSFVPRQQFGAYIRQLLNEELKHPTRGDRLDLVRGDVLSLDCGGRVTLALDRDRTVAADAVVLALGTFPPEPPPVPDSSFYDTAAYRPDAWAPDALAGLQPTEPVLLIGTGLTMVDTIVSLLEQGHTGLIHALSRRGLLPREHAAAAVPPPSLAAVPTRLGSLLRLVRTSAKAALADGRPWQPTIDALRSFTTDIWQAMTPADRRRFLRHLRPWWEVHRHRMPGAVAARVEQTRAAGQLRIHAGRIRAFEPDPLGTRVSWRVRGRDDMASAVVTRVINCSGPTCDYDRVSHPLIQSLLQAGHIRPDPLRLGLETSASGALLSRDGALSGRLFAVGPVTRGTFWEMTAVPDIRRQAELLATSLAALVR